MLEYDPSTPSTSTRLLPVLPDRASLEPSEYTDTLIQGQGQRAILEMSFPYDGAYMFHAHVSEFAELGWSGFFRVGDPSRLTAAAAAKAYCKLPWGGGGPA